MKYTVPTQAAKRLALTHYTEQARVATLERQRDELAEALRMCITNGSLPHTTEVQARAALARIKS